MSFVLSALLFFWYARTLKMVLFWIYLWQLKEYHVGRFVDHFRTQKGKQLLMGALPLVKIGLLVLFLVNAYFFAFIFYALVLIYAGESLAFLLAIVRKRAKRPVPTTKTILLTSVAVAMVTGFLMVLGWKMPAYPLIMVCLLVLDIAAPILISLVVLAFQPAFVLMRNGILRRATKKIATHHKLLVIGITGSYGKTSTKEFLTTILSKKFNVLATPEHKNSEMGIAQTILDELRDEHQIFIVEMGSYNKGGISLLCDMVRPKLGLVTGVNEQHLATFGSLENLLSAEGGQELLASLPLDGTIIVNGDNTYCLELYRRSQIKKGIYATRKDKIDADIWTEEITVEPQALSFIAQTKRGELANFHVKVLGKQNVQNLLGAALMAKELGMTLEEIANACKEITPSDAGMTLKSGAYGIQVIDSSYSSNPNGVMADLDYLSIFPGKKVVVMPCLIELGAKSAQIHKEIGKKIAQVCDLAIITTKDQFEEIRNGAVEVGMLTENILYQEKPNEIFHSITTKCAAGDAVLLEGRVPGELVKLLNGK